MDASGSGDERARSTRRGARGESDRREEIVDATRRVVARDGVAGATTRKIAAEAGLPLGAVHYWFRSKDEVLEALALDHVQRIASAGSEQALRDDVDALTAARSGLAAAMASERDSPAAEQLSLYELTTWALRSQAHDGIAARLYEAIREATQRACEPWLERHGAGLQTDPAVFAAMVSALFDGLALARLADPDGTPVDEVLELFARTVATAARTPDGG